MSRDRADRSRTVVITQAQARFADFMTDVLVYTVVLNLFVEHVDAVVIDSFSISILTAVLLKLLLDVIVRFEHRVHGYFEDREGTVWRVVGVAATISILFLSKFAILEIVNLVFGDHVELGHLIDVIALIIALMVARALVGKIYRSLGVEDGTDTTADRA